MSKISLWVRNCINIQSHALNYYILNLDIDECTNGADNCDVNAYCNNTLGSYTCACKKGFGGHGVICEGKTGAMYVFWLTPGQTCSCHNMPATATRLAVFVDLC
jgi:hypothetical protein